MKSRFLVEITAFSVITPQYLGKSDDIQNLKIVIFWMSIQIILYFERK